MICLEELLKNTIDIGASDLHLTVDLPPIIRCNGRLIKLNGENLSANCIEIYAKEILGDKYKEYIVAGEIDVAYSIEAIGRFRVNVYKQMGNDAIAIRVIPLKIPSLDELNHPMVLKDIVNKRRGLVLVTGPTGSGKSTTLAAMINEINSKRQCHIITLEDPIEYLHNHNMCIINQRQIGEDSKSYENALRSALREDPDVILIGEMRDVETISIAITAAETGHLVLSTLHTIGAAKTIDRIIDVFPPHQQQQVKIQLSSVLQAVISQQLLEDITGNGRVAALEIMIATAGVQNLIREGKTSHIESAIQTGSRYGMKTMDMAIASLYKNGLISMETAMQYAVDKDNIKKFISY